MRAYLVLGPESSGTRLMTRLLIAAGCYGDEGHVQRLDRAIPAHAAMVVWRRSLPHGGQWPDLIHALRRLQGHHYAVTVLVMSRDWHALARSQMAAGHVPDTEGAIAHAQQAYRLIFEALHALDVRFEIVNYESLVLGGQTTTAHLMARLALPVPESVTIYDGNAKHYEGQEMMA